MTVECENCKTRFHVADARIPAKGARVRCSRCHHRFHITPSYTPPKQQKASAQGSAPEPVLGGEAAREEDQLDNPEFLFDKPEDSEAGTALPARSGRQDPREAETQLDQPALAQPPEPKPPPPPPEPRIVASGGMTAQELLDDGEPELSTGRFDIDSALGEPDSVIGAREEVVSSATAHALLGRDLEDTGESLAPPPPPQPSKPSASSKHTTSSIPSGASRPEAALKPAAPVKPSAPSKPAFSELADIAAELGEDEDTSFADWDPLATPSTLASPPLGATAVGAARTTKLFPDPPPAQAAAKSRRGVALDAPTFDPEAAGPAALILRVAAMLVGLALVGAAGRLLWLQRATDLAPPQIVQAAGWVAADLETFLARSASGERVVVVRGNLFPEGAAPPPEVEVRLLGADRQPLVDAKQTWLERVDDAEVAPDRLGLQLAAAGGEIGAIGQRVTGFTAVIPDPPLGVRGVEISLRARERMPDGTATAITPEAPSAEPPTEMAAPTPTALPQVPDAGDVVPAAPEPD
ncbi:MAG: zinc-ribbon domain-containing protein [Myxococcota bacterium]